MSEQQNAYNAYLVVHKLALFNDEWYDDRTLEVGVANPVALFATRSEAEADALARTRALMRGGNFDQLELDEDAESALAEALRDAASFDPDVQRAVQAFLGHRGTPLPPELTDAQLDVIQRISGLKMFHILETRADEYGLRLAQATLALTPERPPVDLEHWYDDEQEDAPPVEHLHETDDPAAARLDRVTRLFGRRYAAGIVI